jgi:YbbR domain-containing protein
MANNLILKTISVVLALGLWFFVTTSDYTEVSYSVPIKIENLKSDLVAINETGLVTVVLRGPSFSLKNISYNDIKISVDASNFGVGAIKYRIKLNEVKVPPGITVVEVSPVEAVFFVDELVTKNVKINPTFIGEPLKGYKVASVEMLPDSVELKGAKRILSRLEFVDTLPINLSNRYETLVYSVGLKMPEGVNVSRDSQIDVVIKFKEDIVEYSFNDFQVGFRGGKEELNYEIVDSKVTVKLKGRSDKLTSENAKKIVDLYVDVSKIDNPGKYLLKIEKLLKDDIEIMSIEPDKVRVKVSK